MKNKGYAKFFLGGGGGGANKVHYGECESGVNRRVLFFYPI